MPQATESASEFLGQTWAVRLGVALLLGFAAITGYALYDSSRRTGIEKVTAPTALEDKAYYPNPGTFDPSTPLANFEGHSLYFVDWQGSIDSKMIRLGMDDTNSFAVYKIDGANGTAAVFYYLKLKDSFYVKTKRQ